MKTTIPFGCSVCALVHGGAAFEQQQGAGMPAQSLPNPGKDKTALLELSCTVNQSSHVPAVLA